MRYRLPDSVPVEADWGHSNYKDIVRGQRSFVESLPYPRVTYPDVYGTWLFFQKSADATPYFCTCQRRPMQNFLRMNEATQTYRLYRNDSLLCHFLPRDTMANMPMVTGPCDLDSIDLFRDNICHSCLLKVPSVRWSNLPAHSAFIQHFGWYWKQALLRYGIDWYMPFLEDQCPEALKGQFSINPWEAQATIHAYSNQHHLNIYAFDHPPGEFGSLRPGMNEMYALSQRMRAVRSAVEKEVERELRDHFGFPPRGRTLNNETVLYLIAKSIFDPSEVVRHARPAFLNGLTLDIFVPDLRIALEYQGHQHFEPADHLGGDKHFRLTQRRDKRKAALCKKEQVTLVYFDVSDKLTEEYVRTKISQQGGGAYWRPADGSPNAHP